MKRYQKIILALLLFLVVLLSRLPGLGSFVAVDEPAWLTRGANFYYALGQREFQNTVYEYHPSVTTMWYVATATLIYFPEYRGLGQGYFDVDKEKFDPFLLEHHKKPLQLLYISRLLQIIVIAITLTVIFYFLSLLFGDWNAFLTVSLISSAPYFLGHSRALSHEAMVAVFVLASIIGLMTYFEYERKWIYLSISAIFAGLAQVTKSSAVAMMPGVGLILLVAIFQRRNEIKAAFIDCCKVFGCWFFQQCLTYFLIWPGMWVQPAKMLYEVYGNAFSYAFQGARLEVTQELEPSQFHLASMGEAFLRFFENILWRSTPWIWLGMIFTLIFILTQNQFVSNSLKRLFFYLSVISLTFIFLFSSVQGRNSAHYIMTSHVSLDLIASFGWCLLLSWLITRWKLFENKNIHVGYIVILIVLQLLSSRSFYPYYYNYTNPIMIVLTGKKPLSDYGEGFEQAAKYLAQKPNAESLKALSFRGRGPFSYFFPGQTIILNPLFLEEAKMASMIERIDQADYLVINDAFTSRTENTRLFVESLGIEPEYSIAIQGVSTIRIYRISDLPDSFYKLFAK